MYLSAINGVNSNQQTNFRATVSAKATDLVAQQAKEAGKLGELSEIMSKLPKWGSRDTMIDYKANIGLFLVNHKNPMHRYVPYGKDAVEQILNINEKTIEEVEKNLLK